ncbi:MAG: hypothetical protein ACJ77B_03940 [Chloroflexota bacterium]
MAILAGVFGALGRFAGKLLTAALGWASTLLFGRVPQDKQILLVLITFGSIVWAVLVLGVLVPAVGVFLLAAVPLPDFVDERWVRLAMLAGALLTPLLVGVATVFVLPAADRPKGADLVKTVVRGYPLAFVLAFVLVFLAVVGIIRKVRSLMKRWSDAHVAVVVRKGGYERMVADLEKAIDDAGLAVDRHAAPTVMAVPGRLLASIAGAGVRSLVPDHLSQLIGKDLEIALYPSDIAISGKGPLVTRARAAIASRLASTAAFLTTSAEAQAIEERLERLSRQGAAGAAADTELAAIDRDLAAVDIPYEEWETLYRIRLQVQRDLLVGARPGEEFPGAKDGAVHPTRAGGGQAPAIQTALATGAIGVVFLDVLLAIRERISAR